MIVYEIEGKAYINLTNKCSNACTFCVRTTSDEYEPYSLWLTKEPTYEEVVDALQEYLDKCNEFVFCGYGEPLYRADMVEKVGKYLKSKNKYVRLNTNGQADLICGEDISEHLVGAVDTVSISLNEVTAKDYQTLCRCQFGEEGYASLLRFAKKCKEQNLRVVFSIVDILGKEKCEKAQEIADGIGAELRIRELIK